MAKRVADIFLLVGFACMICALGVGAFIVADMHHVNPLWLFLSFISIGFVAWAREEYRKEFKSIRFLIFLFGWLVVNFVVVVVVLSSFGWLYLFVALFVEQVLFYMSAKWFMGLPLPSRDRSIGNS